MSHALSIWMVRRNLDSLPRHDLPAGYSFRTFRHGDEEAWAEIHTAAGNFETIEAARARFAGDFGPYLDELADRGCFVVENATRALVGSATAWRNPDFLGERWGHVHWVSIMPEFQGRRLGKALVSRVMERLAESHDRAYLKTKTHRLAAIRIYLDFGFEPLMVEQTCERAWRTVAKSLSHPGLAGLCSP